MEMMKYVDNTEFFIEDDVRLKNKNLLIHELGNLNWEIYGCITDKYVTDEVIITEEQLLHIRNRHPEAYNETISYIRELLKNPDYILRDKHPNTGLVIKRILVTEESNLLVLRISTAEEKEGYKNSVITSWKITEKRLANYLRNKEIIYKKE